MLQFRSYVITHVSLLMHRQRDIVMANLSVRQSVCRVCPSHADIVSKWMHISSNSYHNLVAPWELFCKPQPLLQNSNGNSLSGGVSYTGMWKIWNFRPQSPFISQTGRYRPMV